VKQGYEVKLDLFEGPLDLLLYLVNRAEVNIIDISVSQIASQYLEYLDLMRELNIDVASEYLHMAATLVRLKARELLPPTEAEPVTEEEGIYNREQLIQQLLEYKKYKEAAFSLRTFESQQAGSYGRGSAEEIEITDADDQVYIGNVTIFDLLTAFKRVLDQTRPEDPKHVVETDRVRIDDRLDHILTVLTDKGEMPFEDLFADDTRKLVLVVTFMAILELIKMQEILFRQEAAFGKIYVSRRPESTREKLDAEEEGTPAAPATTDAAEPATSADPMPEDEPTGE
jgi:segregation and condensation protein A